MDSHASIGMNIDGFSLRKHSTRGCEMNDSFNYSSFIEMFLNTSDEFEPYGVGDDLPPGTDKRPLQYNKSQHRDTLNQDPGED